MVELLAVSSVECNEAVENDSGNEVRFSAARDAGDQTPLVYKPRQSAATTRRLRPPYLTAITDTSRIRIRRSATSSSTPTQLEHLGQEPITLWAEMKLSVTNYLTRFEDLNVRCEIKEESCVATARFINGLKFEIKKEVNVHSVTTLEEAYHKALEFETYCSFPSTPRLRPTPFENFQPPQSTSLESASYLPRVPQGIKSFKPGSNPSSSSQIECFNYHAKGHIASRCPTHTLALTEELETPPINDQDVEIVEPLEDCDDLGLDNLVGHNVGLLAVIRCIQTRECDSESLSFGLYSSYTIAHICLEPLPTFSFQKLSTHPIGLGLSSLTLGSTPYLLNLPTNLTIASMTMAALYFIRGTFEPPWGVCDVSTGLTFSTAALAIHMWLVFMQPPSAVITPRIRGGGLFFLKCPLTGDEFLSSGGE
ncbi:hypothetical protein LWI29_018012 [Acer saccharum]|uniref:Uncharacterized protein n=1 Tax=Acer saccharum TaxID=4024 RepID=A0AA39TH97_ACESA|nr:hypothetical protein LWI29_018012 [Acer saccharum]